MAWISFWVCWCSSLALGAPGARPPETTLRDDEWSLEAVEKDLAQAPDLTWVNLDTWIGAQVNRGGLDVGLALVFPWRRVRPGLHVSKDRLGVGVGLTAIPVLEIGGGINYLWDPTDGSKELGVFLSIFKF